MKVAVVGQFSSGKSALINALLRQGILPMGVEPKTAVLHRVMWGSAARAVLVEQSDEQEEISLQALETLTGDSARAQRLAEIQIHLPESFLKDVEIWDTPGFGSQSLSHEVSARKALTEADLALWVTPIDAAITKAELAEIERLKKYDTPVILVVNKADLVDEDEREEAADFFAP